MKPTSCAPFGLKFNPTHRFGSLNLTGEPHILCQISTSIPSAVKVSPKTHVTRLRTSKGAAHTKNCFIIYHHFMYFQVLSHPKHSDMDSKPLLGECWFNLSGGPKPLPIRISSPGSIGNLYHGSCGRGGMAGLPVPSGNLGGFCWIRAANWRSSCFTINIINHKPIIMLIMFDPQSSIIP